MKENNDPNFYFTNVKKGDEERITQWRKGTKRVIWVFRHLNQDSPPEIRLLLIQRGGGVRRPQRVAAAVKPFRKRKPIL
jgi:hypothetical protein